MLQRLKNIYHFFQAIISQLWYGFPSQNLILIGVTGTSGKTTTTHLVYHLLRQAKKPVAMVSSISAIIGNKPYDTGYHVTTPDPLVLPKYLKMAKESGAKYFVLEVSSHALDQNRVLGCHFHIGVLTTLAHEHLDYHKTFENYAKTKFRLLNNARWVVLPINLIRSKNYDVEKYLDFVSTKKKIRTFGLGNADESQDRWHLKLKLPGEYNIQNALAAAAVGRILGLNRQVIQKALENFSGLPGRFEDVYQREFRVIIDFAHKPDALEALLRAAKNEFKAKRIIAMYGCASERDVLKRPIMGEISGKLADITVLTDEDPRYEDPLKIINEIAVGCIRSGAREEKPSPGVKNSQNGKKHLFFKIPDRQEAINFILRHLARAGDIILLCGKGHEQSMSYQGVEKPWSEHAAVKKALQIRSS